MLIRPAGEADRDTVWSIIAPIIAEGEAYALPRDWSRAEALAYWFAPDNEVFVAEAEGEALGAWYLKPNKLGGGAHVANAGYGDRRPARAAAGSRARWANTAWRMPGRGAFAPCSSTS